jgi:hypothetical protein
LSPKVGGLGVEVTNQPVVFVLGLEVRQGLFDLEIEMLFGNDEAEITSR